PPNRSRPTDPVLRIIPRPQNAPDLEVRKMTLLHEIDLLPVQPLHAEPSVHPSRPDHDRLPFFMADDDEEFEDDDFFDDEEDDEFEDDEDDDFFEDDDELFDDEEDEVEDDDEEDDEL